MEIISVVISFIIDLGKTRNEGTENRTSCALTLSLRDKFHQFGDQTGLII